MDHDHVAVNLLGYPQQRGDFESPLSDVGLENLLKFLLTRLTPASDPVNNHPLCPRARQADLGCLCREKEPADDAEKNNGFALKLLLLLLYLEPEQVLVRDLMQQTIEAVKLEET